MPTVKFLMTLKVNNKFNLFIFCFSETLPDCSSKEGESAYLVAVLLFALSQAIAGFGGAIYTCLGSVYIDDNVKKSKAPIMLCLSRFVHLLASAAGYSMASFCLKYYISPSLHPKITDEDPRWIGKKSNHKNIRSNKRKLFRGLVDRIRNLGDGNVYCNSNHFDVP